MTADRSLPRRAVLAAGAAGLAAVAGCGDGSGRPPAAAPPATSAAPASRTSPSPPPARPTSSPPAGPTRPPGEPAVEIVHGPRDRPEVALTFHGAGDPGLATSVLATLERAGARVTVLAVGTWLAANPQLARRIVGAGHELGNHTWTHPVLDDLGAAAARVEIERCRDLLVRLTGSPGGHVRQSGGQHATPLVLRLAGAAGYPVSLSYDVDSLDWTDPGPAAVRRTVAARVQPGSVVSMHFGHPGTLTALPGVLADLARRRLRPVTATRLLTP
jgi:peptidoglycan/xylan/chitin deacetylase (PgdA/CDA1 family)